MDNPEDINTNNNGEVLNSTENASGKDCTALAQLKLTKKLVVQNIDDNKKTNNFSFIEKDNNCQQLFMEGCKTTSSGSEINSNIFSKEEFFSGLTNENQTVESYEDDNQDKSNLLTKKTLESPTNVLNENITLKVSEIDNKHVVSGSDISLCNGSPSSISNHPDMKNSDTASFVRQADQFSLNQSIDTKCNIIPNPNQFDLIGKSIGSFSLPNSDILDLNRSTNGMLAFSDSSIVISNSNAIPQSDSIVSSNYSLAQLQAYESEDDSLIEELPVSQQYREGDQQMEESDEDSDSSTSSSTSILISDSSTDTEDESGDEYENCANLAISKPIKAKGELDLSDLPPIEDLHISVPEDQCIPIGTIYQIVDQLVIVQAIKDSPAYDLDTVLFTQGGQPLGKIFDVFGPVTEPYYCIRFNSKDHIKEKNIALNQTVYCAPKTKYSKFVFLAQLMQLKGSDASWENDQEPPEMYLDYSDDEQEQKAKKRFFKSKKALFKADTDPDEPARKRHSAYVKKMNARNLRLSAVRSNQDRSEKSNILWQSNLPLPTGPLPKPPRPPVSGTIMFESPPMFDIRVPPPNAPFPNQSEPLTFYRPEYTFPPQIFTGPSTSSHYPRPPPFVRPGSSPGPGMQPFSPPPCNMPGPFRFQGPSSATPPNWNQSFPNSENPWAHPFSPVRLRHAPPPPLSFLPNSPFPIRRPPNFHNTFPNRPPPPQPPPHRWSWPAQPINQGNPSQLNFNPSVPPPSPNIFKN